MGLSKWLSELVSKEACSVCACATHHARTLHVYYPSSRDEVKAQYASL